jgi:hypothetical protein
VRLRNPCVSLSAPAGTTTGGTGGGSGGGTTTGVASEHSQRVSGLKTRINMRGVKRV